MALEKLTFLFEEKLPLYVGRGDLCWCQSPHMICTPSLPLGLHTYKARERRHGTQEGTCVASLLRQTDCEVICHSKSRKILFTRHTNSNNLVSCLSHFKGRYKTGEGGRETEEEGEKGKYVSGKGSWREVGSDWRVKRAERC